MKKICLFLIGFCLFSVRIFAAGNNKVSNTGVTSETVTNGSLHVVVLRDNDMNSEKIFTVIPEAPEGYHLIGIETYFIMEGKDHIKRVFIFSNDDSIRNFALTSAAQTDAN